MSTSTASSRLDLGQYLIWEATQSERHELVDGDIFQMTGGSTAHGAVGLTLLVLLKTHLISSPCRVFWPDVKLRVDQNVFYPDIKVRCHAGDLINAQYIEHPVLIAEILSPATEDYDKGRKFDAYRRIPELREYLLINPDMRTVELRRRTGASQWEFLDVSRQPQLQLESLDFECPVTTLFEDLPPAQN